MVVVEEQGKKIALGGAPAVLVVRAPRRGGVISVSSHSGDSCRGVCA